MADIIGRRKLFIAGVVLFTLGSLLSGLSWDEASLIGSRAIQGLGADRRCARHRRPLGARDVGHLFRAAFWAGTGVAALGLHASLVVVKREPARARDVAVAAAG